MPSSKINIFLTGATGYLGGTVLSQLLNHAEAASFNITALVRSTDKAEKLKTLGVKSIIGSYTDENLQFLTDAAARADIVITMADSDGLPPAQAILEGLKIKYEKTNKAAILIHASGSAIIMDDARGLHANETVWSDLDVEKLNALPATALHRNVDIALIEADKAGYVKTYLVTPGTLFGQVSGPLTELNIQNTNSIQVPLYTKLSLGRKQGGYIGKGANVWSAADVNETAALFVLILDTALKNPGSAGHGTEGYYFAESTTYNASEVAQLVTESFVEFGLSDKTEGRAFSQEELDNLLGPIWPQFATNSVVKADRGRALGWKPKASKKDFLEDVKIVSRTIISQSLTVPTI